MSNSEQCKCVAIDKCTHITFYCQHWHARMADSPQARKKCRQPIEHAAVVITIMSDTTITQDDSISVDTANIAIDAAADQSTLADPGEMFKQFGRTPVGSMFFKMTGFFTNSMKTE